ncbi:MAG: hypothetical protein ABI580_14015 [Burkholderiaceae bacterium]
MAVTMDRDKGGADDSAMSGAQRELTDRYRQASDELGERPSASARASILAAAAREVRAKPVDAATLHRARPRWPLAAAAAVMLSTLAVMLAIRTNEEMPQFNAPPEPQFSAPAEPARSAADNVVDSVATPAASPPAAPMAEQSVAKRSANGQQAPESQPTKSAATPPAVPMSEQSAAQRSAKDEPALESQPARTLERSMGRLKKDSNGVAQAPREASPPVVTEAPGTRGSKEEDSARQNLPASSPAVPPPPEAARPKLRAEQGTVAGAAAPAPPMDQAGSDARRDAAKPAATAPLSAAQSERKQVEESAAVWLERIIKLRREGRHDEADAELKRFRERYPQVQPPAEALLPAGTR